MHAHRTPIHGAAVAARSALGNPVGGSAPPPPCQPLPPSRVSHGQCRAYRVHSQPPSLPHDSHTQVRDTAPASDMGVWSPYPHAHSVRESPPSRRPVRRFLYLVSANRRYRVYRAYRACTADHHPSLTARIPTFEILSSIGDMGIWSSHPRSHWPLLNCREGQYPSIVKKCRRHSLKPTAIQLQWYNQATHKFGTIFRNAFFPTAIG